MAAPLDDLTFYDDIEGYCSTLSVVAGSPIGLHVSTKSSEFSVTVERWGATRELVWSSSDPIAGAYHPAPNDADRQGCNWSVSVEIPTTADWKTGFYLITLIAIGAPEGRNIAHAGVVVRSTQPAASALFVLGTNTWNAYNTWGGCSLYTRWARSVIPAPIYTWPFVP